jgi:flavocytochrome c
MDNEQKNEKLNLTRRDLLKGTGGAVALGGIVATGLSLGMKRAGAAQSPDKWDRETDVIIVGFGGTGAAAAIEAHDAGAKVLILEKAPMAGGNTAISGGIIYAAGTAVQKAAGVKDSPDNMYNYWMAVNKDLLDPELLRLLSEKSAGAIEWLKDQGVEITPETLYHSGLEEQYESIAEPAKRGHCAKGKGRGIMSALERSVKERKIDVLYRTSAERLIADPSGNVIGVTVKGRGGQIHIKAKRGVVLSSGGFTRNKEMVNSYFPLQLSAVPVTAPGLTGDGIMMAEKIGSPIVDTGTLELPPSLPALEIVPGEKANMLSSGYFLYKYPAIFINDKGRRFCNETDYYQIVSPQILTQKSAFIIFDQNVRNKAGGNIGYGFSDDLSREIKEGWLKQASSIGELAKALTLESSTVEKTVSEFNKKAREGKDPDFGRKKAMEPIETPPFYGGNLTVTVVESFGGLRIDSKAQVLDVYNEPIPGLYAGGATAASMRAYAGSGAFLVMGFVFGRIAGKNAAKNKA